MWGALPDIHPTHPRPCQQAEVTASPRYRDGQTFGARPSYPARARGIIRRPKPSCTRVEERGSTYPTRWRRMAQQETQTAFLPGKILGSRGQNWPLSETQFFSRRRRWRGRAWATLTRGNRGGTVGTWVLLG